jgi:hypothetical protein
MFFAIQFVFCRDCLQGYHIDECQTNGENNFQSMLTTTEYVVDPGRAAQVSLISTFELDSRLNEQYEIIYLGEVGCRQSRYHTCYFKTLPKVPNANRARW